MDVDLMLLVTVLALLLVPILLYLFTPKHDYVTLAIADCSPALSPSVAVAAERLEGALPGRVFARGDRQHERLMRSFWAAQEEEVVPAVFVKPSNTKDVAKCIELLGSEFVRSKGPKEGEPHFAIRSGGHGPGRGNASAHGGITIDLSDLNQVTLSEDKQTVAIGPAARWGKVYTNLEKHGLTVAGGRAANVGVGGLVLGGGISFFSPKVGFVCDNIISFEVVLADASIVTASATSHPDLFQALKGGSNNFGVVTKLVARAFPCENILYGYSYHWHTTTTQHLDAFYRFCNPVNFDESAGCIMSLAYVPWLGARFMCNGLSYTKPEKDPVALRGVRWIPRIWSTVHIRSQADATIEVDGMSPPHNRQLFHTTTFEANLDMLHHVYELFKESQPKIRSAKSIIWPLTLQALSPSTIKNSTPNALGIKSDKTLVNVLINATWKRASDDALVYAAVDELFGKIEAKAKELGVFNRWKYMNYAAGHQDVIAGYGEETKRMLQDVSRKYDPEGLFQKGCVGGFKVFKDDL